MTVTINFMENLLLIAAEAESLIIGTNRSYEQSLKEELLKIIEEAESLFGPRDRSYDLLEPRITERHYAQPAVYPARKIRIYLTREAKHDRYYALYELAHEAIHVLSPISYDERATTLEEGVAEYFAQRYVNRVFGVQVQTSGDRYYDAAVRAVSPLLAKNQFVIKELRARQPVISRIDVKLLVEVAGIDLDLAQFLCRDFHNWRQPPVSLNARATQNFQLFARGVQSIWDQLKAESKA